GLEFSASEARLERFLVQAQGPGVSGQIGLLQLGLVSEERVVKLPKLPLLAGAAGPYRSDLRVRVDFSQRKVQVSELHPAVVLDEKALQSVLRLLTERALKIGELDDGDGGLGISLHAAGVVRHFHARRPQINGDLCFRPQRIRILQASLLDLGVPQEPLE